MKRPLSVLLCSLICATSMAADAPSDRVRTYDQDPSHLWNRLHHALFIRTAHNGTVYGEDRLDPLFWGPTKHLLEGTSHQRALQVLDEFQSTQGEKLIGDPLRRAFLQHDLWALFAWSAAPPAGGYTNQYANERIELQRRLAPLIRRLSLTNDQLQALGDNYARAEAGNAPAALPRGLFRKDGDWVNVTTGNGVAPRHTEHFDGRAMFHVLVRLPEGRAATLAYLERLRADANSATSQFPAGTEWALVRRMSVIDVDGRIRPTRIIESIEIRRYASLDEQRTSAFIASRSDAGELREVQPGERDFYQFQAHQTDPFELSAETLSRQPDSFRVRHQRDVLRSCAQCHGGPPGIRSVLSFMPQMTSADLEQDIAKPVYLRSYEWGLLRGLWAATASH